MFDISSVLLAGHQLLHLATGTGTTSAGTGGLGNTPTSVNQAVSLAQNDISSITGVTTAVFPGLGGLYAAYHAVGKAHAQTAGDTHQVQTHNNGIKYGIYAGVIGGGAMGIIHILSAIL